MKGFILVIVCLIGILVLMSVPAPAHAQRTPDQVVMELVRQAETTQIDSLIQQHFDIRRTGRFVLGRYWRHATARQRWKFLELFEATAIKRFGPLILDVHLDTFKITSISYHKTTNFILVVSTVKHNDKFIKVQWRLRKDYSTDSPTYKVIDITVEGISLALTLRAEYGEIVNQHGIKGLIDRLERS